jgi:hypothetical protein
VNHFDDEIGREIVSSWFNPVFLKAKQAVRIKSLRPSDLAVGECERAPSRKLFDKIFEESATSVHHWVMPTHVCVQDKIADSHNMLVFAMFRDAEVR